MLCPGPLFLEVEAAEVCDEKDNNCDSLVDEEDPDVELSVWYFDEDYDGFGDDLLVLGGGEGGLLNMPSVLSEDKDGGTVAETRPTTATTATYQLPPRAQPSVRPSTAATG